MCSVGSRCAGTSRLPGSPAQVCLGPRPRRDHERCARHVAHRVEPERGAARRPQKHPIRESVGWLPCRRPPGCDAGTHLHGPTPVCASSGRMARRSDSDLSPAPARSAWISFPRSRTYEGASRSSGPVNNKTVADALTNDAGRARRTAATLSAPWPLSQRPNVPVAATSFEIARCDSPQRTPRPSGCDGRPALQWPNRADSRSARDATAHPRATP